jgi:calcineurin-like phosphoesterase family protein
MTIFFTSDLHFGHENIIKYCGRPWSNVQEMNEALITNWNSRVQPGDTVYLLGDFAMGQKSNILFRKRLNGKIILIRGNHDRKPSVMRDEAGFDEVHDNLLIQLSGLKLYLAHIPVHLPDRLDDRKHDPKLVKMPAEEYDYFLCGHVHEKWKRIGNTINVGCDVSGFVPLTLHELLVRDPVEHADEIWKNCVCGRGQYVYASKCPLCLAESNL